MITVQKEQIILLLIFLKTVKSQTQSQFLKTNSLISLQKEERNSSKIIFINKEFTVMEKLKVKFSIEITIQTVRFSLRYSK